MRETLSRRGQCRLRGEQHNFRSEVTEKERGFTAHGKGRSLRGKETPPPLSGKEAERMVTSREVCECVGVNGRKDKNSCLRFP